MVSALWLVDFDTFCEFLCFKGRDPFNQNSNRSDRKKWSTSKGGPVFSKLFRLDRTDQLSFGPKFPEILVFVACDRLIMTEGSKKRNCEGGFWTLELACFWKAQ